MADNYLEKKMEEHRQRSGAALQPHRHVAASSRPGTVSLKLAALRILVSEVSDDTTAAIVGRLREAGCKVAFGCRDNRCGAELAQKTGSRFYPSNFVGNIAEDLCKVWDGVDMMVIAGTSLPDDIDIDRVVLVGDLSDAPSRSGVIVNVVNTTGLSSAETAGLVLLLCLSESDCLNGVIFKK